MRWRNMHEKMIVRRKKMIFMNTNEVEVSDKDRVKRTNMILIYFKSL